MITFSELPGGITVLHITNPAASAEISLYGGHVLSYMPARQTKLLFLSSSSFFEKGKAIRGGIPVCWPWFGPHPENTVLPQHGFVRTMDWRLATIQEESLCTTVVLECLSTPETLLLWPHEFKLTLSVSVGKTLEMTLATENTGHKEFRITDALHTYFSVGAIDAVRVTGLENARYIDKAGSPRLCTQQGEISVTAETDKIYLSPSSCSFIDPARGKKITVEKTGFPDTIVWNPWKDKAKAMQDFGDEEWQSMLCVEAGSVKDNAISVQSGQSICQTMIIQTENT